MNSLDNVYGKFGNLWDFRFLNHIAKSIVSYKLLCSSVGFPGFGLLYLSKEVDMVGRIIIWLFLVFFFFSLLVGRIWNSKSHNQTCV